MLSTIASISPLLGLLGTVVGMIKVFSNIDINGSANSDLLAAGISEALITTAFGLIIAVPAIIFYRYFEQKTVILMSILQANTSIFLDFIYKK
jgi:biopolymer transport protein ExbB